MRYTVYKLKFRKQDKFYIGCTKQIGERFQQHLNSWFWVERGLIPEGIEILYQDKNVDVAAAHELKWITDTWDDNFNSREMMYPIHNDDEDDRLLDARSEINFQWYKEQEVRDFKKIRASKTKNIK